MVETRGYTLEEIAIAFDGPRSSMNSAADVPLALADERDREEVDDKGRDDVKLV